MRVLRLAFISSFMTPVMLCSLRWSFKSPVLISRSWSSVSHLPCCAIFHCCEESFTAARLWSLFKEILCSDNSSGDEKSADNLPPQNFQFWTLRNLGYVTSLKTFQIHKLISTSKKFFLRQNIVSFVSLRYSGSQDCYPSLWYSLRIVGRSHFFFMQPCSDFCLYFYGSNELLFSHLQ